MSLLALEDKRHDRVSLPVTECSITQAQIAALAQHRMAGKAVEVEIRSGREVRLVSIERAQFLPQSLAERLPYTKPVVLEGKCLCTSLPISVIWDSDTSKGRAVIDLRAA